MLAGDDRLQGPVVTGSARASVQEVEDRDTVIAHTDATKRQITLVNVPSGLASIELHQGLRATIGDEGRFEQALRLVDNLLAGIERDIARLEPRQRAKAEQHGFYPPPAPQ